MKRHRDIAAPRERLTIGTRLVPFARAFDQRTGEPQRGLAVPRHQRPAKPEHHIVTMIGKAKHAFGRRARHRLGLGNPKFDRSAIGQPGLAVTPDPIIGVARHVDEVRGLGRKPREPVGERLGPARLLDPFGGVDVEMDRRGIFGIACKHLLQQRHRPARIHCSSGVIGCRSLEPGIGGNRPERVARRIGLGNPLHRNRKLQVAGLASATPAIALDQCCGQLALERAAILPRHPVGLAGKLGKRLQLLAFLAEIDRRAVRPGFTPGAHRATGVEPPGFLHRRDARLVGKGVGQLHSIVEIGLRLRDCGGHRKTPRPITVEQHRARGRRPVGMADVARSRGFVLRNCRARARNQQNSRRNPDPHRRFPVLRTASLAYRARQAN